MKHSEIYSEMVRHKKVESFDKARIFESNISNGRKIFRLFLWLNEINELHNICHSSKLTLNVKVLKTISSVCSFIYYFTDNIVWLSKIGFVDKFVPFSQNILGYQLKWGKIKDQFSLCKTMLELVIYIYIYKLKYFEDKDMLMKLRQFGSQKISRNKKCFV